MHSNQRWPNSFKKVWKIMPRFSYPPEYFCQFLDFKNHKVFFLLPPAIWNPQANSRMTNPLRYGKNETEYSESCQMQNKQTDIRISPSLSIVVISVWVSTSVQKSSDSTDFQTDNISSDVVLEAATYCAEKSKPPIPQRYPLLVTVPPPPLQSNCFFHNNLSHGSLRLQFVILREFSAYIPELPVIGSSVKSDS